MSDEIDYAATQLEQIAKEVADAIFAAEYKRYSEGKGGS